MAVVGSAEITVRAITLKVKDDIQKAFKDAMPAISAAGKEHGKAYLEGFSSAANDKLPSSIEQSLKRTNTRQLGREKGDDFTNTFQQRANLINLERVFKGVDASGAGDKIGGDLVDHIVSSMQNLGPEAEKSLGDAGTRGGRNMGSNIDNEIKRSSRKVTQTLTSVGNDGGNGLISGLKNTRIGEWFQKEVVNGSEEAAKAYKIFLASSQALTSGIGTLVAGLSAVVSSLFAVASAVGPAIGALGALPGVLFAAAQAGLTLKLAFSGVGKAITAGLANAAPAVGKTASATTAAAKAIRNAMQGIADANRTTARAIVDAQQRIADAQASAARAVKDAKDNLKQAYSDAAQAAAAAARDVANAERDVGDAQRGVLIAQLALTDARKAGAESLQQLGFSAEGAALSEQRAGLSLQDAYAKLQSVQNLPPDNKSRVEAELSFKEAELHYRESKDRAADLKKEEEKAAKAGVDGTKEVVDAKDNILKAKNDEIDAENRLAKARTDQANTAIKNSNKIIDAQNKVARAQSDGAKSIAEAEKALTRAREDGAIRGAKAQQTLKDAQDQMKTAVKAGTPTQNAYNKAIKDLSPEARNFVKYMIGMHGEIVKVKAAAGKELFPKLQTALEPVVNKLFPTLRKELKTTGGLLGDVAIKISGVVTSKDGLADIKKIFKGNNDIIKIGGDVIENLVGIFLKVLIAVQPVTKQFANFAKKLTDGWAASLKTKDGMKKLTDFFTEGGKVAGKLYGIFKQLWGIIMTLGGAAKGSGNDLLDSFKGALTNLQGLLDKAKGDGSLQKFFATAAGTAKTIFTIIGRVGGALLKLGGSAEAGDAFKSVKEAGPYFTTIFDTIKKSMPAFGRLFKAVARVFAAFTAGDSSTSLFETLGWMANKLADFLEKDGVQSVLKFAAPFLGILHAVGLLFIGLKLVLKIAFGLSLPFGKVLKVLGAIGRFPFTLIGGIGKLLARIPAIGKAFALVGRIAQGIGDKLPGGKGRKAARAAAAAGGAADDKDDGGTAKFSGNLEKLAGQFKLTGKAKDNFIKNLQELSIEFGKVGTAASGADPSGKTKGKLKKGSAASKAPAIAPINQLIHVVPPPVSEINAEMRKVGQAASLGLAEGIKSPTPIQAMEAENARIIAATKEGFGIHSPSTVFLGIGRNLGEAVALGMKETGGLVKAEATSLTAGAATGAKTGVKEAGAKAAGGAGVIGSGKGFASELGKTTGALDKAGGSVGKFAGIAKVGGLAVRGLGGAVSLLGGPIGIIMLVLPILVKIFEHFYKNNPGFKKFIDSIVDAFKKFGGYLLDFAKGIFPALQTAWAAVVNALKAVWDNVGKPFIDGVVSLWNGMVEGVKIVIGGLQTAWGAVVGALKAVWDTVGAVFLGGIKLVWQGMVIYVTTYIKVLQFIWEGVVAALKFVWDKVGAPFVAGVRKLWDLEVQGVKNIIAGLQAAWGAVVDGLKAIWNKVGVPFINAVKGLWDREVRGIKRIFGFLQAAWNAVINAIKGFWNKYGAPFIEAVRAKFSQRIDQIKAILQKIKDKFSEVINGIKTFWTKTGSKAIEAVRKYFSDKVDKVKGYFQALGDKFTTIINGIKTFWSKTGAPIIDTIATKFSDFGDGVAAIWDAIKDAPKAGLRNLINNLNNWLVKPLTALTSHFGLDIPDIPMPNGLSEGGFVDGHGGPTEDNQIRRLSVGEAVLRERSVRSLGRDNVAFMNRTGTLPVPSIGGLRGNILTDAKNGLLGKLKDGKNSIEDLLKDGAGAAINKLMDGFKGFLPQGSGFIEDLLRRIFDKAQEAAKSWGDDRQAEEDANNDTPTGTPDSGGKGGSRGVWNALITAGMTKKHAAGIMGNMQSESNFQWNVVQGGRHSNSPNHGGTGYGLVQWTPSTKLGKMLGNRANNLENQIAVLLEQLKGKHGIYGEGRAGGMLERAGSVAASAKAFMLGYERPKNKSVSNQNTRAKRAEYWYNKYKGATTPDDTDDSGGEPPATGGKAKTRWRGGTFTKLFVGYLKLAETLWGGGKIHVTQGGFQPSTSYSGSTHNKDALDTTVINKLIRALRAAGLAAGDRTGKGNWRPHVHVVPSPSSGYGSPSARAQYRDYARRGYDKQSLRSPWGLALGGTVRATPGGILAQIGEGGKNERVEPLDSSGLSVRDRALIEMLTKREGGTTPTQIDVRVHIGDTELNGMIDMRIAARDRALAQDLIVGNKRRYRA